MMLGILASAIRRVVADEPAQGAGPPQIGDYWEAEGGWYAGTYGAYYLVLADKASEQQLKWKSVATVTAGAASSTDGKANTAAIIAAGIEAHPAAQRCVTYSAGGFTDWYLPAVDELAHLYSVVGRGNATPPAGFEHQGPQAFVGGYYWSSTSLTAMYASNLTMWIGTGGGVNKTDTYYVRPVRRVPI